MTSRLYTVVFPAVVAMYVPFCAPAVRPTMMPWDAPLASLWVRPSDLAERDLFNGPWGAARAPDPHAIYALVEIKRSGVNPGMTVRDRAGRKWSVKQASPDEPGAEGPVEVVLSRVLSALGYHQPPVYYLPSFSLADDWGTHPEPGGRFRLHEKTLKDRGEWSWQQNPFVGMKPFQGLLVVLLMFNSTDLKNSNNTLYQYRTGDAMQQWYVVRDIGSALGDTARLASNKNDAEIFARSRFILGVRRGFVEFDYHGWHQELFRDRITPDDVGWASHWLAQLSDRQWHDAFRAGGYPRATADRFIEKLQTRIAEGQQAGGDDWP
jgi:hypothetical protein